MESSAEEIWKVITTVVVGAGGGAGILHLLQRAYGLYNKKRGDDLTLREKELELEEKQKLANFNLSIKEEQHIESQFQAHFKNQEAIIQRLQKERDARIDRLEKKIEEISAQHVECIENYAVAITQRENLEQHINRLDEEIKEQREAKRVIRKELDEMEKKYRRLQRQTGMTDSDSTDVEPGPDFGNKK